MLCWVWMAVDPYGPVNKEFNVPLVGEVVVPNYQCGSRMTHLFGVQILVYKVLLTLFGAFVAFRVRNIGGWVSE